MGMRGWEESWGNKKKDAGQGLKERRPGMSSEQPMCMLLDVAPGIQATAAHERLCLQDRTWRMPAAAEYFQCSEEPYCNETGIALKEQRTYT